MGKRRGKRRGSDLEDLAGLAREMILEGEGVQMREHLELDALARVLHSADIVMLVRSRTDEQPPPTAAHALTYLLDFQPDVPSDVSLQALDDLQDSVRRDVSSGESCAGIAPSSTAAMTQCKTGGFFHHSVPGSLVSDPVKVSIAPLYIWGTIRLATRAMRIVKPQRTTRNCENNGGQKSSCTHNNCGGAHLEVEILWPQKRSHFPNDLLVVHLGRPAQSAQGSVTMLSRTRGHQHQYYSNQDSVDIACRGAAGKVNESLNATLANFPAALLFSGGNALCIFIEKPAMTVTTSGHCGGRWRTMRDGVRAAC